jgi:hypothetical protein
MLLDRLAGAMDAWFGRHIETFDRDALEFARVVAPYSLDPSNAEPLWESSLRLVTRR